MTRIGKFTLGFALAAVSTLAFSAANAEAGHRYRSCRTSSYYYSGYYSAPYASGHYYAARSYGYRPSFGFSVNIGSGYGYYYAPRAYRYGRGYGYCGYRRPVHRYYRSGCRY